MTHCADVTFVPIDEQNGCVEVALQDDSLLPAYRAQASGDSGTLLMGRGGTGVECTRRPPRCAWARSVTRRLRTTAERCLLGAALCIAVLCLVIIVLVVLLARASGK